MKIGKLVAHIPARAGSKRVRSKNLRLLLGKPMIQYAIDCAKACEGIDEIYVNTDSPEIMELARSLGVGVFVREGSLASDTATGDDFTNDIIEKLGIETLMMISPVCPLVSPEDVDAAIRAYTGSPDADALITCSETTMQVALEQQFINIDPVGPLKPSQDNPRVQTCNWAVTIWNGEVFKRNYSDFRGGYCGTNRILHPIDPMRSVKVSYEEDFRLVEALLAAKSAGITTTTPEYWTP